ncbi:MAG TPA: sulfotransferase [Fimbriimonadaceae bacterium]
MKSDLETRKLTTMPNIDDLIRAASAADTQGRLEEAERLAYEAWQTDPENGQAALLFGIVAAKRQNPTTAIPALHKALEIDPDDFDAAFWLSLVFRKIKRMPEALCLAERAVTINSKSDQAQNHLGMCYLDLNEAEEAANCFGSAATLNPSVAPYFDNLGRALQMLGRKEEAILALRQALAIGPVTLPALFKLGEAFMAIPDVVGAAQCAREMLKIDPNSATANLLLGRALIGEGQVAEGARYAKRAMELAPGNGAPVAYYGRALQSLGQIEEANEQFEKSIELMPRQGFAYHALFHNRKVTESDRPLIAKMNALRSDPELPKRELIQLEYALGKAYDNLGDYKLAMDHYDEANRIDHILKVGVAAFNKEDLRKTADFLIRTFTAEFLALHKVSGNKIDLPVFVVGMMRSGTTLAEQILSSHSKIGGVGEQLFWPDNAGFSEKLFGKEGLETEQLQVLTQEYLVLLESISPGHERVVDKMNTNYLLLGLLHTGYPNAKIVHMMRDPIDTCLSIWATPVANGIDLCGEKENVVFAYEQYLRVMEHWRSVLPKNALLDIQYEDLVNDQETQTRKMIEFVGLPWESACLHPEKNERSVKTPSVWQVRQPVYKTSTQRWRKYEPWLGAFTKLKSPT